VKSSFDRAIERKVAIIRSMGDRQSDTARLVDHEDLLAAVSIHTGVSTNDLHLYAAGLISQTAPTLDAADSLTDRDIRQLYGTSLQAFLTGYLAASEQLSPTTNERSSND
jgi:hypothetical protein